MNYFELQKLLRFFYEYDILKETYTYAMNIGFLFDPDPEFGLCRLGTMLEKYNISDPLGILNEKDIFNFKKFLSNLKKLQLEKMGHSGWRLSHTALISFYVLFQNRDSININFLIGTLNWDENTAKYFLSILNKSVAP